MRSLKEVAQDMRGLAALLNEAANEIEAASSLMASLFGGGSVDSAPFPRPNQPSPAQHPAPRQHLSPGKLAQLRAEWDQTPPEFQNTERRRELAQKYGLNPKGIAGAINANRRRTDLIVS